MDSIPGASLSQLTAKILNVGSVIRESKGASLVDLVRKRLADVRPLIEVTPHGEMRNSMSGPTYRFLVARQPEVSDRRIKITFKSVDGPKDLKGWKLVSVQLTGRTIDRVSGLDVEERL